MMGKNNGVDCVVDNDNDNDQNFDDGIDDFVGVDY